MTTPQKKDTAQTSKKQTTLLMVGTGLEAVSIGFAITGINISSLPLTSLSLVPALFAASILKKLKSNLDLAPGNIDVKTTTTCNRN